MGRIAIADFNNDDLADIAASANLGVAIFLGNGDATFDAPVVVPVTSPGSPTAGDFNADGDIDLAVLSHRAPMANSYVSILLGNGDGTFATGVDYAVQVFPLTITLADFNGDLKTDLAVGNTLSNTVSILLGVGDGTFGTANHVATGATNRTVAVADFNGDTKLDMVTGNNFTDIKMLLGNGDGTFAAPVSYASGGYPHAVVAADFNLDGAVDAAVASRNDNNILLHLGNGNGTLNAPISFAVGNQPEFALTADLNVDGRPDIVTPNWISKNVSVLLGTTCTDLTLSKTHTGNFSQGQTGATYTLTVTNTGGATTRGTVTVTDTLPAGLTATAMSGTGWNCLVGALACNRTDALGGGASYPPITLTVNVSSTAPAQVTNTAVVSGIDDSNPNNSTASDATTINQVPDLTITKSHTGNFAQGQSGRTYTITVSNIGGSPTSATVTVTDNLPAGLNATAMSGTGWSCNVGTLTCTRADALAAGGSYPAITLTVTVTTTAPSNVVNSATVSTSGEFNTSNNTANDPTSILVAPTNLIATAISTTQTSLSWTAVAGATRYQVFRSSNGGGYVVIGQPVTNSFSDQGLSPNTTYVYVVKATDGTNVSPSSNADVATTMFFTDDPATPGSTLIRAVHILELRTAVNFVRTAAGLPPASFTTVVAVGQPVRAADITEVRTALNAAFAVLGIPAPSYTDPSLGTGTTVKAAHVNEPRRAVE